MAQTLQQQTVIEQIVQKLRTLRPERLDEVEDFIDFLSQREDDRQLTRAAMSAISPRNGRPRTRTPGSSISRRG